MRRRKRAGLTLIEAAIVVSLVGVVLAVFVPTFVAELRTSKVSEASEELAAMHTRAAAYFATDHSEGRRRTAQCLPASAGPTPAEPSAEAVAHDFEADETEAGATWRALGFQPTRPIRYRYTFVSHAHGCGLAAPEDGPLVTMRAEGDLDGDGKRSLFEREATVADDGSLQPTGVLYMLDRVE